MDGATRQMWVNSKTWAECVTVELWISWSVERQSVTINWQPATHSHFIHVLDFCLTCTLWSPGSSKPCIWCFVCQTSCWWRRGYSWETGTLTIRDKGAQSWPTLKLSPLFCLFFCRIFSVCLWAYLTAVVWREKPPVLFFHVTVKRCHPALTTLASSYQLWFP